MAEHLSRCLLGVFNPVISKHQCGGIIRLALQRAHAHEAKELVRTIPCLAWTAGRISLADGHAHCSGWNGPEKVVPALFALSALKSGDAREARAIHCRFRSGWPWL